MKDLRQYVTWLGQTRKLNSSLTIDTIIIKVSVFRRQHTTKKSLLPIHWNLLEIEWKSIDTILIDKWMQWPLNYMVKKIQLWKRSFWFFWYLKNWNHCTHNVEPLKSTWGTDRDEGLCLWNDAEQIECDKWRPLVLCIINLVSSSNGHSSTWPLWTSNEHLSIMLIKHDFRFWINNYLHMKLTSMDTDQIDLLEKKGGRNLSI